MRNKQSAKEINIKEVLEPLLRHIWLIVVVTMIFTFLAYFNSKYNEPPASYQSSAKIIVNATAESMSTLQVIIKDTVVLEKVVSELNLPLTPEQLAERIEVSTVGSSYVVIISVVYPSPELAAEIANTTARIFKETVPSIFEFDGVNYLSGAKVNPNPIETASNTSTIAKIGLIGTVLGIGLAYLLNIFDSRIRTVQDVEENTGMSVIGYIYTINNRNTRNFIKKNNEPKDLGSSSIESKEV